LQPLGQADISPFIENLLQAASATPHPTPKAFGNSFYQITVINLTLFLFRRIRLFFFISPAWFFVIPDPQMLAPKITM
jgi:hypothetical protein